MKHQPRLLFLFVFIACASLLGFALYLQLAQHLLPCPLCVAQRLAYWLTGLTALLAFLHNPGALGRRIYSALLALPALAGALVAGRHAWLVRYPESFDCGISPEEKFLNALPFAQWWPGMFEANGDCAHATGWKFLSLMIPDWSLVWFLIFGAVAVYLFFAKER